MSAVKEKSSQYPMAGHPAFDPVSATERSTFRQRPTEVQTENGFAIIRLCDVDDSYSTEGPTHCFIVRDPDGYELDVTVEISATVVGEIMHRTRGRISLASTYWIACAERHLTDYLWEREDFPPDARLVVDQPSIDDFDAARRWNGYEDNDE
jgi:hypothetical protein